MLDGGDMQLDLDFGTGRLKSMADAVRQVIGEYRAGHKFHGNELHGDVSLLYPPARTMYTDTVQRAMRRHCRHLIKCIDQNSSLYEKQ
ncbi:MAG: hypothetical protein LBH43_18445 [Treponema sp.]|nr:hypothetical protein [Treponema sp.]